MKVYLVYGLAADDLCEEPFVKKVFYDEQDAKDYAAKKVLRGSFKCWFVEEMEVE